MNTVIARLILTSVLVSAAMLEATAFAAEDKKAELMEVKEFTYLSLNLADQPLVLSLESGEPQGQSRLDQGTLGGKGLPRTRREPRRFLFGLR